MKMERHEWLLLLLFLVLCYFPIFHHLGVPPIKGWDESLFGMRMLYLYETGSYLPYFNEFSGEVIHQNLKPPLMTFVQVLFFPILENQDLELTLRLPIALCVLGTVLLTLWYSKKETGKLWWGMLAGLVLLTSEGYTRVHVGRTGDHDAALAFFMLIGFFAFYRYLNAEKNKERNKHLIVLTTMLLISFLTKSIVGFFFIPGFIFYAAFKKQLLPIFKRPSTYIAAAVLLISVVFYYFLMDHWQPGFLKGIRGHALGRYTVSQGHNHPFDFYFKRYYTSSFRIWIYFLPLAVALVFSKKQSILKNIGQLACCCALPYLLIISFSQTKLPWYDAAVYPLLAVLVATAIYQLWQILSEWSERSPYFPKSAVILYASIFLFLVPYVRIVSQFSSFKLTGGDELFGYLMKQIDRKGEVKDYYVFASGQNPQLSFYSGYFNQRKDYNIKVENTSDDFKVGDHVMLCQDSKMKVIAEKFEYDMVEIYEEKCRLLRLKVKR